MTFRRDDEARRARARLAVWTLLLAAAIPGPAAAQFSTRGTWAPAGLSLGGTLHADDPASFFIGAEGSYVRMRDPVWYGAYVDALFDTHPPAVRMSVGPEVGYAFVGVDGGYVLRVREDGAAHGLALRGVLTAGVIALTLRVEHFFRNVEDATTVEVGVLLKFPIPIHTEPVRPYGQPPPEAQPSVTLSNDSDRTICFVYMSPTSDTEWGADWLGANETIAPHATRAFHLQPGAWDLKTEDCEHGLLDESRSVVVERSLVLHLRAERAAEPPPATAPPPPPQTPAAPLQAADPSSPAPPPP